MNPDATRTMTNKSPGGVVLAISGAAAAVIGAVALAIWPPGEVGAWLVKVAKSGYTSASDLLTYPLPAWLFVVLLGATAWLWTTRQHRPKAVASGALSDLEQSVIEVIAVADGTRVSVDTIARVLNVRQLVVEQAADQLRAHGVLDGASITYHDAALALSPTGREFALRHRKMGDEKLFHLLQEVRQAQAEERRYDWMRR